MVNLTLSISSFAKLLSEVEQDGSICKRSMEVACSEQGYGNAGVNLDRL